jgi:hypothetical protein
MTIFNRASTPKQLQLGLNKVLVDQYGAVENEHLALFEIENSKKAYEEEVMMGQFGLAETKAEGEAVRYDTARELWTSRYTHETIALAFAITEEAVEDNLYGTVAKLRAKGLGRAMGNTKQIKAAAVFNNGFSTSYLGGDAAALFSTTHPTQSGGDLSNRFAVDLSETALENISIAASLLVDDRGMLIGARTKSLHVPPQLKHVARRLLMTDKRPGTADNDVNSVKSDYSSAFIINHRFTDTNAFFVRTDVTDSTKMFVRIPLGSKMEGDFDTGNMRYKVRERYSFGWSDWRGWLGSAGAT